MDIISVFIIVTATPQWSEEMLWLNTVHSGNITSFIQKRWHEIQHVLLRQSVEEIHPEDGCLLQVMCDGDIKAPDTG